MFSFNLLRLFLNLFFVLSLSSSLNSQVPKSAAYAESEITFSNREISLAGSLLMPAGAGPFPAVVIIHGSGTSDRGNEWTSAYAKSLAARGIAVLYPDKRGSGKSQGNWKTASFTDLADDAIAGVNLLLSNPKIDKARCGVIGFSQGGHIVPVAASRSANIAFAIDVSGSTVPILEQTTDEIVKAAQRLKMSSAQIDLLREINRLGVAYALTGKGIEEYKSKLESAKAGELKGNPVVEGFPTEPDHWKLGFVRAVGDFDPIPFWKKTTAPALFIYGGRDTQIDIEKSMRRIDENLKADKRNFNVLLFNTSGHAIFRDDLIEFVAKWIMQKGED